MKANKVGLVPYKKGTLVYVFAECGGSDDGIHIVTGETAREKRWGNDARGGWDIWQTVYSFQYKRYLTYQVESMTPVDGSGQRWEIVGEGGESGSSFDPTRLTLIEKE